MCDDFPKIPITIKKILTCPSCATLRARVAELKDALGYTEPILNETMNLLSWAKHDLYNAGMGSYLDKINCTQVEGEDALNRIRTLI